MKFSKLKYIAAALMLLGAQHAYSAGTTQGTTINNSATVDYTVGGVNQPDVTSNTASFVVDRRINLTVAEVGGAATSVAPGQTNQVTTYTVTNTTNGVQDFRLSAAQQAGGGAPLGGTDNFNANNVRVFVESGATAGFQAAEDTATFVDELAADASRTVYVVVDIPAGQANGDIAAFTLTAIAANSGTAGSLGADATQTSGADTSGVDTVFGDAAGDTDSARDGQHSDDDQYNVVTATLGVVKTSTIVSDPHNGTTNPKAIPGAVLEYCIDVNNTGASAATTVVVTDAIPSNTTYVAASMKSASTGSGTSCDLNSGTAEDDDNVDVAELDGRTADFNVSTAGAVTIRINSIAAGAREKMLFRVTVN
jgi:uncharacterized repeat protein (TIGR01451 family)